MSLPTAEYEIPAWVVRAATARPVRPAEERATYAELLQDFVDAGRCRAACLVETRTDLPVIDETVA